MIPTSPEKAERPSSPHVQLSGISRARPASTWQSPGTAEEMPGAAGLLAVPRLPSAPWKAASHPVFQTLP